MKFADTTKSTDFTLIVPEEDQNEVSFVVFNDVHDRPNTFHHLLNLTERHYDYVVLNGDIFGALYNEEHLINDLLNPVVSIFAKERPFIYVRGNHETRGKFAGSLMDHLVYPNGRYYCNYETGPVNITILDSGEDKADDSPYYGGIVDFDDYRREQGVWLDGIMKSRLYKSSPFKVVFMHMPPFHSDQWHGTLHCREVFTPLFEKYNVDLVIAGHTHRYGIHPANKDHSYPIVIGGGPNEGERTLIVMKATHKILNIDMLDDNGILVGQLEIKK